VGEVVLVVYGSDCYVAGIFLKEDGGEDIDFRLRNLSVLHGVLYPTWRCRFCIVDCNSS
jgi:hypothetical protein